MKKPRSDSTLLNLPPEQEADLVGWMLSGLPYGKVLSLLVKTHKVKTSNSSLGRFYEKVCVPALLERRRSAAGRLNAIADEAKREPGHLDEGIIDSLKTLVGNLVTSEDPSAKDVKDLFGLVLKANAQSLDKQQLALARNKFEFDAAKAALSHLAELREIQRDGKLDDDAKLLAVRKRLFGEVPA